MLHVLAGPAGKYKKEGELIDVVIKQVARGQEDEALAEAKVTRELHAAHSAQHHPCVLYMHGVTQWARRTLTVMEVMNLRGMEEFVFRDSQGFRPGLRKVDVVKLLCDAAKGLAWMTAQGYAHRDGRLPLHRVPSRPFEADRAAVHACAAPIARATL